MNRLMDNKPECRIVSIHQPNFLPWIGYFNKIRKCDTLAFLDDVKPERSGADHSFISKLLARYVGGPYLRSGPFGRRHTL